MKIYLAGPDIFRPDVDDWITNARELCRQHGFEALTPFHHGETEPKKILDGNLELIRKAQIVVANLNPFRGFEPDSGTAFELGYTLALGKKLSPGPSSVSTASPSGCSMWTPITSRWSR